MNTEGVSKTEFLRRSLNYKGRKKRGDFGTNGDQCRSVRTGGRHVTLSPPERGPEVHILH